jgi:nitrite reductase/ring-hydroxylating ferredoxin subunit
MPTGALDRRTILAGTGSVCALALLGACARAGGDTTASRSQPARSGPAASQPPASSGPPRPAGFLAAAADVPVGGGLVVKKDDVLLVQPAPGTIKAYDAHCPHQGIILPPPDSSGIITCPNHLARYRAADGSLIDGPAPTGLTPIPVKVADGQVLRA